eukprot:4793213-Pyramimonas_sp.AAC.1
MAKIRAEGRRAASGRVAVPWKTGRALQIELGDAAQAAAPAPSTGGASVTSAAAKEATGPDDE